MRRAASILAVIAAALAGGATAHGQDGGEKPALRAALSGCAAGGALFTASMPAGPTAERMAMRFDLMVRRTADGAWRSVELAKWSVWQRSDAGVPGFIVAKGVDGLTGPGSYRAVVRFRWYDADGRVIRRERRTTRPCVQADPRPDLAVARLTAVPAADGRARYTILLENAGRGDAGPFAVALSVAGAEQPAVGEDRLAAGERRELTLTAPACTADGTVTVALDTTGAVDEAREGNNVVTRPCPLEAPVQ